MSVLTPTQVEKMIFIIRGQKVMLDSDLAELYGVETKVLNQQVKRNLSRFPKDFMFQLSVTEYENLMFQIGTSKIGHGGRRKMPLVFTEQGVAMLSTVLNSEQAIQVNISIMRIFTKLRSFHLLEKELTGRIEKLEAETIQVFKVVFERLDDIEVMITPMLSKNRKKISLKKAD